MKVKKFKKKTQTKKAFSGFQVHIQERNKTPFVLYSFLFKKQFHMKLIF
jgi:hypothetical protein